MTIASLDLRARVLAVLHDVAATRGATLTGALDDDTVLLESGLDSLGFAILVARLEEELGYDPFVAMEVPVYPRTLGEFLAVYERFAPRP